LLRRYAPRNDEKHGAALPLHILVFAIAAIATGSSGNTRRVL
jgi:hypothetical protein